MIPDRDDDGAIVHLSTAELDALARELEAAVTGSDDVGNEEDATLASRVGPGLGGGRSPLVTGYIPPPDPEDVLHAAGAKGWPAVDLGDQFVDGEEAWREAVSEADSDVRLEMWRALSEC